MGFLVGFTFIMAMRPAVAAALLPAAAAAAAELMCFDRFARFGLEARLYIV